MRIRESAIARGIGVGLACLQGSATVRSQTLATSYAIGHALDPAGFQLVSLGGDPEGPEWERRLLPLLTGGTSWVALHSALVPLARRSKRSAVLVAVGYAVVETVVDSFAADWAHQQMAKAQERMAAQQARAAEAH